MTVNEAVQSFDYKKFYTDMTDSERLQVSRDELDWVQGPSNPDRTAEVVLNLSCGGQTNPYVMLTQVALFKALGVDFVATAGQNYCCGNLFNRTERPEIAVRMARTAIRRLSAWQSTINVQSCGSCQVQFTKQANAIEAETGTAPFKVVHYTDFLLQTLKQLGDKVPWRQSPGRRVLLHAEGAEIHRSKAEAREAIIETFNLIPGVEFAGFAKDPSIGLPCRRIGSNHTVEDTYKGSDSTKFSLVDITPGQYRQVQAELEAQARAVGANIIATPHFTCQREWSKFGSDRLPIVYYGTLVAEALGITIPDRFQILWRQGDPEKVLEMTRPHWESWNISEQEAREIVKKTFVPKYANAVQKCPCEGNCFESQYDLLTPEPSASAK